METDRMNLDSSVRLGVTVRACASLVLGICRGALTAEESKPAENPKPPGIVIDHRAASTRQFIGSPSLAILAGGDYVASHDWFGPGSTRNRTVVFGSRDHGQTWKQLTEIEGQWWST